MLWSFQSSFLEALPEKSRKEVERSAQRRSEDAERALKQLSEALRGCSEDPQRMFRWLTGRGVRATLRLTATKHQYLTGTSTCNRAVLDSSDW